MIGYHYVIEIVGTIKKGREESQQGAGVKGHNHHSIHICYVGGLDQDGKPKDTRTHQQQQSLVNLLKSLKETYKEAVILGHRDLSPDMDGDGKIEKHEWLKACPCFNAKEEFSFL